MTIKTTSTFDIPTRYPSTAAYAKSREDLLEAENAAAFDYTAVKSASSTERKANKIVKALLELESDTLYGVHHNGSGHEPAHQFRRSKHLIDDSKLLEIAKRAPKGALLHCHFDAMLPPSALISIAAGMANMHIRTDAPLIHTGFYEHALTTFQVLSKGGAGTYANTVIFGATYVPGDWMLFSKFRESFPGGAAKADEWVSNKIVLDVEDIYHTSPTVNGYLSLCFPRNFWLY
jgi:adenosine deaminase CECR1